MSVAASLAVMRNAFSTATSSAKIPDGAVSSSISERSATAGTLYSPSGQLTIVLTPSLDTHLQYSQAKPAGSGPALTAIPNTSHSIDNNAAVVGNIDQWRLVSAALRCTCINGSETLNGWFEAIRLVCGYEFSTTKGVFANDFDGNITASTSWPNHPSYVTGRLRDLGKHTFYLQPTDRSEMIKSGQYFDTNYDVVLLRIHSIPQTLADGQTAEASPTVTGIHYHVVRNFELCYDAQSNMSRFQTGCPVNMKAVDNTRKAMTRDSKASMIRAASAYAYR